MHGCQIIIWGIMVTPIVLLAILFSISPEAGFRGLAVVVGAAALYFGGGFLITWHRRTCPSCGAKKLEMVGLVRTNPGPGRCDYRCERCGAEFESIPGRRELFPKRNPRDEAPEAEG
ncbi:MAG: hypothetical protein V3T86_05590 [Planctomycetota bacterium]